MGVKDFYPTIIKEFEFYFPEYSYRVVHWYPVGYDEVMMILDDGRMLIYDAFYNKIKFTNEEEIEKPYSEESEWRKAFGKRLERRMILSGYHNIILLSEATGISRVTLGKYLNGQATPSGYNMERLARALKCSVTELYNNKLIERRQ